MGQLGEGKKKKERERELPKNNWQLNGIKWVKSSAVGDRRKEK